MTNKEAIRQLNVIKESLMNCGGCKGAQQSLTCISKAIKALEVVDKIKQVYVTSYKNLLGNLENGFTEEMATPVFYHDVAYFINNILCDAYDTEEMMSWLKEAEKIEVEEPITLTDEQITEMWESGYISDKEEYKDGND